MLSAFRFGVVKVEKAPGKLYGPGHILECLTVDCSQIVDKPRMPFGWAEPSDLANSSCTIITFNRKSVPQKWPDVERSWNQSRSEWPAWAPGGRATPGQGGMTSDDVRLCVPAPSTGGSREDFGESRRNVLTYFAGVRMNLSFKPRTKRPAFPRPRMLS